MILIDSTIVDEDILRKQFVCDLSSCKGSCCEKGVAGAPLEEEELMIISEIYEQVKPYLTVAAIEEIERDGTFVQYKGFGKVTPTLDDDSKICVYGVRDDSGVIKCSFEQAFYDGKTKWKKPISCHLYPIIIRKAADDSEIMSYEPRETLCSPACDLGDKLKIPIYEFLKEAIIRKYGDEFYNTLNIISKTQDKSQ